VDGGVGPALSYFRRASQSGWWDLPRPLIFSKSFLERIVGSPLPSHSFEELPKVDGGIAPALPYFRRVSDN
jgi:hypothetical protein